MKCLLYLLFPTGIDRPLTRIRSGKASFPSDSLAIVEPEPYPTDGLVDQTDTGSQWRIVQSLALLPLGTAINRGPLQSFQRRVGSKGSKEFPASSMSCPSQLPQGAGDPD